MDLTHKCKIHQNSEHYYIDPNKLSSINTVDVIPYYNKRLHM